MDFWTSSDPTLPEWLHLNGYKEWMVKKAAEQYLRTEGTVLLLPDDILKIPSGWEDAVKRYANLIMVAKPQKAPNAADAAANNTG